MNRAGGGPFPRADGLRRLHAEQQYGQSRQERSQSMTSANHGLNPFDAIGWNYCL
jgi:hypothetical protein